MAPALGSKPSESYRSGQSISRLRIPSRPSVSARLRSCWTSWGQGGTKAHGAARPYAPEEHGNGCLLIDFGESRGNRRWRTAIALLDDVVRFWCEFFTRHHAKSAAASAEQGAP